MKCKDCEWHKELDVEIQLEGGPEWVCTKKHSECEDVVCLLRMIIWELYNWEDDDD